MFCPHKWLIISSNMNASDLDSLGILLFGLATGLTYIIIQPLKSISEPLRINQPGRVPVTAYGLASFALSWAILLATVLSWLISRAGSISYWVTITAYALIAFAAYGLFHLSLIGRLFSLMLCAAAALISVILYNSNNQGLTAGGAGLWFLPFAILSIYSFRHRRDYAALWKSGKIDSRKPAIIAVIVVYYIIVFAVKFGT